MARLGLLLLALADILAAQDDPTDVLMRLRDQVTTHGRRIPNHTCVETIQRDRFQSVGHTPSSCDAILARRKQSGPGAFLKAGITDRLRLDVAVAEGREIYSWAGAGKFEDGDIDELILEGPMGTGPFATMLMALFAPRNPRFFYDGETTVGDKHLMQFSFTMPQAESSYRVKAGRDWLVTGYSGTLLVEPHDATLVRLVVRTDELPPASTACETDTTLEYATVQLGGLGYLLPKATRQRFISRDGQETENAIAFSSCREYGSESSVSFGGGSTEFHALGQPKHNDSTGLPAALPVSVELTSTVSLDEAAAGDPIDGRLANPIRDAEHNTLVPAGAVLKGRLMRVETRHSLPPEVTVALHWEAIEINGLKTPISLRPVRTPAIGLPANVPLLNGGLHRRGVEIELPMPGEARYAIFRLSGDHPVMKTGLRSDWMTTPP